jgi:hypothetical protein
VNELGLKGKIYYKTVGEKTYVILKGLPQDRAYLTGTRYLNTHPEIIRFSLAKVSLKDLYKTGFKSSLWVYCGIKALEGLDCLLNDDIEPSFFSNVGIDIPKIAINSLATAAIGTGVAVTGFSVAVGAGIVLIAGFGVGILLELLYHARIGL